jgi:signal transduction histidine kinase/HD-like signal output (HDOD) protein
MTRLDANAVARQVEMILGRLTSLATLPQVAAGFLPHLAHGRFPIAAMSEIIESDPALTARILSLAAQQGVEFSSAHPSVAESVAKLPAAAVRDAVLSVKIFGNFDGDTDPDARRILPRKQLALFSLATACCARQIAEVLLPEDQRQLAFTAGLLSNIGILALDEVMPKSLEKIIAEARDRREPLAAVERRHLGLDHILLGKRLAESWSLPREITVALWLQNTDLESLQPPMPGIALARIVRLAAAIARNSGLGHNGDFDALPAIADAAAGLSIGSPQIEQIRTELPEKLGKRAQSLGLDMKNAATVYLDMLAETAARLAGDNTALETRNRQAMTQASQLEFIQAFVRGVGPQMSAVEIAAHLAQVWQQRYQTGTVCVAMQRDPSDPFAEMISLDGSGRSRSILLKIPAEGLLVPDSLRKQFGVAELAEASPWIAEQLDFDLAEARIAPLLVGPRAIGAVIFQNRIPIDVHQQAAALSASVAVAAHVLAGRLAQQRHSDTAEQFADLLGHAKETRSRQAQSQSLSAITEVAAGAAHELNTPLTVISGRAQLLYEVETDDSKRNMLKQIQDRSAEISDIVTDLMHFAKPMPPSPQTATVQSLIDNAAKIAAQKHGIAKLEMETVGIAELGTVFVDPGQVTEAIVRILLNAVESYKGENGPVRVEAGAEVEGRAVLHIRDSGCGMDAETIKKVFQPFFSAKPAGRKRGMGLSHAQRLLAVNDAAIRIASEPGKGTTVTIELPRK